MRITHDLDFFFHPSTANLQLHSRAILLFFVLYEDRFGVPAVPGRVLQGTMIHDEDEESPLTQLSRWGWVEDVGWGHRLSAQAREILSLDPIAVESDE